MTDNGDIKYRTWADKAKFWLLFIAVNWTAIVGGFALVKHFGGGVIQIGQYAVTMANVPTQIDNIQASVKAISDAQLKQISDQAERTEIGNERWKKSDDNFQKLDNHVDDLENRVEHLEQPALKAFGAMATNQDDLAYMKCCTRNNCKSWDRVNGNPCLSLKRKMEP